MLPKWCYQWMIASKSLRSTWIKVIVIISMIVSKRSILGHVSFPSFVYLSFLIRNYSGHAAAVIINATTTSILTTTTTITTATTTAYIMLTAVNRLKFEWYFPCNRFHQFFSSVIFNHFIFLSISSLTFCL